MTRPDVLSDPNEWQIPDSVRWLAFAVWLGMNALFGAALLWNRVRYGRWFPFIDEAYRKYDALDDDVADDDQEGHSP